MVVIHVAPTPFGRDGLFGGGERYPLELARALAPHVECELITFGAHAAVSREPDGLRVRTLPAVAYAGGHPAHPIAPGLAAAVARAEIVHTHHMRSTPRRLAALAGRVLGRRVVTTDHGLQGGDWAGFLPRLFNRFLLVSAYSARELGVPPRRTRVLFGGANPHRFSPGSGQVSRSGVLFVGRLTPHKGVDRLIEALPPGAQLRIVGTDGHAPRPPERDYGTLLRRLAEGLDVRFEGAASEEGLPAAYREAVVLALPSVQRTCYGRDVRVSELLGLVAIEAMMSGTPVVCSRLGGLPEVVEDGVTGYLVEPGNVEELRDRLAELLSDRPRAARMGARARERAIELFTWKACAARCLAAYQELT